MTGEEAVEESLEFLRSALVLTTVRVDGHYTIVVSGCDEPDAIDHFGRFLVGVIAQAVRTDLLLQPVLLSPGLEGQAELTGDLDKLLGPAGQSLSDHERTHGRNPWIGECLGHLMLILSGEAPHPCVPAPVVAARLPHVEAREHGLDLFALLHPDVCVLIGEAKTSRANIAGLLTQAEASLRDIEDGLRDNHVRQAVNGLQSALSPDIRALLVGAIWKQSRCYAPVVVYESGLNATLERTVLSQLASEGADCRMIVVQHRDHDKFFEDVALSMRAAVSTISPV